MTKYLMCGMLLLTGCEFLYKREVRFKSIGINHQPVIQVDYSQMPNGSVTIESESGQVAATEDSKVVYRLHGPAKITITPLKGPPWTPDSP